MLGIGFGYLGSRAQTMSTGCEPQPYGIKFAAGDTIGVLLNCNPGAEQINFFVNDVDQGVAFNCKDLRCALKQRIKSGAPGVVFRPAVAMSKAGVLLSIRHRSATALLQQVRGQQEGTEVASQK